jgi:hypothetical protein
MFSTIKSVAGLALVIDAIRVAGASIGQTLIHNGTEFVPSAPTEVVPAGTAVAHSDSPYTAPNATGTFNVDTSGGVVTFKLPDGSTEIEIVLVDSADSWATNNLTVGVSNAAKKLCGVVNDTQTQSTKGSLRGYRRTTDGQWHGGV